MASYSIADARDRFSSLVEAAERGENIEITRYGRPVAVISSLDRPRRGRRGFTVEDLDVLREWRKTIKVDPDFNGAAVLREMRDED